MTFKSGFAGPAAIRHNRESGGGTGLRLSIVAAVVGAHSGRVFIVETPGEGATLVVELPAFGMENDRAASGESRSPSGQSLSPLANIVRSGVSFARTAR